jgi:hypothetical protein
MSHDPVFRQSGLFKGRSVRSTSAVLGNAAFLRSWAGRRLKASSNVGAQSCSSTDVATGTSKRGAAAALQKFDKEDVSK